MPAARLGQLILYVQNIEASVQFYRDGVGFELLSESEHWSELKAGEIVVALHAGGEGRLGEDAPEAVLYAEDLATERLAMQGRGVAVDQIVEPHPGVRFCRFSDPDGHRWVLKQA